jgi:hypothetical protein
MKHDQYREWLLLSLYGELDSLQQETLDEHFTECADCRAELEHLKAFNRTLSQRREVEVDDRLLQDARRQFRTALMGERSKQSMFGVMMDRTTQLIHRPVGIALGGAAVFILGIMLGYSVLTPVNPMEQSMSEARYLQATSMHSDSRITNVRYTEGESRDGTVELNFDAVIPVHMQGNIDDPQVQKVLAYALISSQNPGVRLQTANMLASQSAPSATGDADIKEALITALETDENPGVRREALAALQKFHYDDQVKRAYLTVLMKDKNSGMRIGVINALIKVQSEGLRLDSDVISVMHQKKQSDDNSYIRTRATSFLEGIQQ